MAYYKKGDNDRAIADETQAIKLEPLRVSAPNLRLTPHCRLDRAERYVGPSRFDLIALAAQLSRAHRDRSCERRDKGCRAYENAIQQIAASGRLPGQRDAGQIRNEGWDCRLSRTHALGRPLAATGPLVGRDASLPPPRAAPRVAWPPCRDRAVCLGFM